MSKGIRLRIATRDAILLNTDSTMLHYMQTLRGTPFVLLDIDVAGRIHDYSCNLAPLAIPNGIIRITAEPIEVADYVEN